MRLDALIVIILLGIAWAFLGYDSTIATLYDRKFYGLGVHFSTLQAMAGLFYILIINIHVGGLRSWGQLSREIKGDLRILVKWNFKEERENYKKRITWRHVSPFQAVIFSGLAVMFASFVFEIPYIFALNYFHFQDLLFPIYQLAGGDLTFLFWRNLLIFILPISFIFFIFPGMYKLKLRTDHLYVFTILVFLILGWMLWIYAPTNTNLVAIAYQVNYTQDLNGVWMPQVNKGFPQTTYLFYELRGNEREVKGFWIQDDYIHTLNILTKYLSFALIGFIFSVKGPRRAARDSRRGRPHGYNLA